MDDFKNVWDDGAYVEPNTIRIRDTFVAILGGGLAFGLAFHGLA